MGAIKQLRRPPVPTRDSVQSALTSGNFQGLAATTFGASGWLSVVDPIRFRNVPMLVVGYLDLNMHVWVYSLPTPNHTVVAGTGLLDRSDCSPEHALAATASICLWVEKADCFLGEQPVFAVLRCCMLSTGSDENCSQNHGNDYRSTSQISSHLKLESLILEPRLMAESYVAVAKRAQTKPISALPLAANAIQTVTGVVCAFAPPKKTRGSDWAASFVITDPSIPLNKAGLTINVFRPHPEMFPELHEGSIVRIEGLKIQTFNGRCQGLSNRTTSFHIVDDDSEIHTLLANWYIMLRSTNVGRQNMTRSSLEITRRPILLVSEITIAKMCDLKATVVHIDGMLNQGQFELTLTDFTDNPLLNLDFSENEQDGLGVFPANMLVRLVAWDENIEQAKLLAVGDRVVFVNVRPKLDDKGRLELYMHGDKQSFGTPRKRIIFLNTISDEDVPRMESYTHHLFQTSQESAWE